MHKLFEFIVNKKHWFLFILLETFAFFLLFNTDIHRKTLALFVENTIVGNINSTISEYKNYIGLRVENDSLRSRIGYLEELYMQSLANLEEYKSQYNDVNKINLNDSIRLKYIPASIINRSKYNDNVYYVVNKGSKDGIRKELGVVSCMGVVGSVMSVSKNYSVVIPIINPLSQLSCRIKDKEFFGSLSVLNGSMKKLKLSNVPSYIEVSKGDTIVTSGYSTIFPKGIKVGVIEKETDYDRFNKSKYFKEYTVDLFTDFDNMAYVYILVDKYDSELDSINREITMIK